MEIKNAIEPIEISATSSLTINLGNYNSARLEFSIKKRINDINAINLEEEKSKLWDEVNQEVDNQVQELKKSLG